MAECWVWQRGVCTICDKWLRHPFTWIRSNILISANVKRSTFKQLDHWCARVAHCVTARWLNFSHHCRPLRHYGVWLRVLMTEKHWQPRRQHTVYRNKRLEHGCANHDTEGKRFKSPIHCCDATKPPYLLCGKLCTSHLLCELLFVYIVCCLRTGQCFSVLRTR